MTQVSLSVPIDAPPAMVWEQVSDLASHTRWMRDAVAIRFVSAATTGTGVRMDCDTKIGPFRLTDRLVVTEWEEGRVIAIRHEGAVTGTGRFTLEPAAADRTIFRWTENLHFPWWLGGMLGELAARPVFTWTWRRNLAALASLIEQT